MSVCVSVSVKNGFVNNRARMGENTVLVKLVFVSKHTKECVYKFMHGVGLETSVICLVKS